MNNDKGTLAHILLLQGQRAPLTIDTIHITILTLMWSSIIDSTLLKEKDVLNDGTQSVKEKDVLNPYTIKRKIKNILYIFLIYSFFLYQITSFLTHFFFFSHPLTSSLSLSLPTTNTLGVFITQLIPLTWIFYGFKSKELTISF